MKSISDESDEPLWQRVLVGDSSGYAVIFDRHRDRVYRHAFHLSASQHDAEDVLAVAFLELWRRRAHVHLVDGSALPWLLATATNSWRNIARSRRRFSRVLAELERRVPPPDPYPDDTYADRIDAATELATIRERLATLSERDAALLSLTALEDYPVAAAAKTLGMTAGAARVRLHRIRSRLRMAPAPESKEVT